MEKKFEVLAKKLDSEKLIDPFYFFLIKQNTFKYFVMRK